MFNLKKMQNLKAQAKRRPTPLPEIGPKDNT